MYSDNLNNEVTKFLDNFNPLLRVEIDYLRNIIMCTDISLSESIKWNGPNYSINGEDRITIRINSPKQIQIIFHRGAKVQEQPQEKIINDKYKFLIWKENDRAIASFKNLDEIQENSMLIQEITVKWIHATVK